MAVAVGSAAPVLVGTAAADPGPGVAAAGSRACTWSAAALPQVPDAFSGYVRGTDGHRTFAGQSGDQPVLWRDGHLIVLGPSGAAEDVNRRGEAVGATADSGHALLWRGATQIPLAEPEGFASSTATAINDAGLIVGYGSGPETGGAQGLVWRADAPDQVRVLPGPGGGSVFLADVNRRGVIVGTEIAGSSLRSNAVIGTLRSGLRALPTTPGATESSAAAIAGNYVVGTDSSGPVRWYRDRPERLPGGGNPQAVNGHGLAAGYHGPPETAYVWQHSVRVDLPGLVPDALRGATAVGDGGQVAGFSSVGEEDELHGIRYEPTVWNCR
ncbi:MAG TPA: hypothetical protein VGP36_17880 [Mycobacteriales bacterium]|nr:hypothetical protein [Mycobacteriales bacterium]